MLVVIIVMIPNTIFTETNSYFMPIGQSTNAIYDFSLNLHNKPPNLNLLSSSFYRPANRST